MSIQMHWEQFRPPKWARRNFITEVLIPSLFQPKGGVAPSVAPVFPKLSKGQVCITWIGHASFLIQFHKFNVLVDPNWANWLLVIRRLKHAGMTFDQLPNIDLVLITHAHFDHLNRRSLRQVAKNQTIVVPKHVKNLVEDLGFRQVIEMEWWDSMTINQMEITFTPAKHWGARTLLDKYRGYGGYVLKQDGRTVYHCGDSSYFNGFKEIGTRLKPEISLMPIGAYQTPSFRDHHISPEQALDAFSELKAKIFIPMHWGTYRLSYEALYEPPQRLMRAAAARGVLNKVRFLAEGMPQIF